MGTDLLCLPTGERFRIGAFATPSLAELRALVPPVPTNSPVRLRIHHVIANDIFVEHAKLENRGATFQVGRFCKEKNVYFPSRCGWGCCATGSIAVQLPGICEPV